MDMTILLAAAAALAAGSSLLRIRVPRLIPIAPGAALLAAFPFAGRGDLRVAVSVPASK